MTQSEVKGGEGKQLQPVELPLPPDPRMCRAERRQAQWRLARHTDFVGGVCRQVYCKRTWGNDIRDWWCLNKALKLFVPVHVVWNRTLGGQFVSSHFIPMPPMHSTLKWLSCPHIWPSYRLPDQHGIAANAPCLLRTSL